MKKIIYSILFIFNFLEFTNAQNPPAAPFVIPALKSWQSTPGTFQLGPKSKIIVDNNPALKAGMTVFLKDLQTMTGWISLAIKNKTPQKGDIYVSLGLQDSTLGKEGYILEIGPWITIKANTAQGAFWGTRSVLQILEQNKITHQLPQGIARDFPDYEVRGFVLDVGRKFFTIDFLRKYVQFMAYYKMNDFHIHLNDNGFKKYFDNDWAKTYSAFRLENDRYPGLTATDGHYSKKEFRDLQAMARSYGVNIVPEIDVPAHSLAFVKAVPEIGSKKYGLDHLDISLPKTYEVIDQVFKEYLEGPNPVFTGPDVHIGTDEYAKEAAESFRKFTDHYIRLVQGYGKNARLWGALTMAAGKTPVTSKNVTMNLWYNGYAEPKEMFAQGFNGISTPDGYVYIVPAAGYYYDYLNTKMLYNSWAPNRIGKDSFSLHFPQIKGGSFAVWNDIVGNGISEMDVHHRVFPAMQVLAQKMWTATQAPLPYDSFMAKAFLLPEAPGLNMLGKYGSEKKQVLHETFNRLGYGSKNVTLQKNGSTNQLVLKGGQSYYPLPYSGIGYNYTVTFELNPSENNPANSILFSSPDAIVKLKQGQTGKLGFSRDGYDYAFDYTVPENKWTQIAITGTNKGTALYVNGHLIEKLEGHKLAFPNPKDSVRKVETLFFPLQYIGAMEHAFSGSLKNLHVYNYILTDTEIAQKKD